MSVAFCSLPSAQAGGARLRGGLGTPGFCGVSEKGVNSGPFANLQAHGPLQQAAWQSLGRAGARWGWGWVLVCDAVGGKNCCFSLCPLLCFWPPSAVVSGKRSLSGTNVFVHGSRGDSGGGITPGASSGEFLVCHQHQVVLWMGKSLHVYSMEQLDDGCLVLSCHFRVVSW